MIEERIIEKVCLTDSKRVCENFMLFLFKTYHFERGIIEICNKWKIFDPYLLNFYI